MPLQDLIAVVERQNAIRAALALRLLPRQKSIAVFDALDAKHQADIIDELGNADVYEFFDELDPEDRVALLDELPAEIADRLLRSLTQSKRDVTGVVLGYDKGSVGRRMSPEVPGIHQAVEFGNRLLTFLVVLTAAAAVIAVTRARRRREVLFYAWLMPASTVLQAVIGGITVLTGLLWWTVAIHLLVSMAMVWLSVLLFVKIGEPDAGEWESECREGQREHHGRAGDAGRVRQRERGQARPGVGEQCVDAVVVAGHAAHHAGRCSTPEGRSVPSTRS